MVLTAQEESLIDVLRKLPPSEASRVYSWANHLGDLSAAGPVDWSDSWTDEDLADVARYTFRRLDDEERENR